MPRLWRSISLLVAASALGLAPAASDAAPSIAERVSSLPQGVGKLVWAPDGRAWSLGAGDPKIGIGTPDAKRGVKWSALPTVPGVAGWQTGAVGDDGAVYVAGLVDRTAAKGIGRLVKRDATTGAVVWQRQIGLPLGVVRRRGGGATVLTRGDLDTVGELQDYDAAGRPLGSALRVPGVTDTVGGAPVLSLRSGTASVLSIDETGTSQFQERRGKSWTSTTLLEKADAWTTVATGVDGTWVFGDPGDADGVAGLVGGAGLLRATLPTGVGGCPATDRPAFHGAGVAGPDGALWLRATCFSDDDARGPSAWLRIVNASGALQTEVIGAPASAAALQIGSISVGPDAGLWSIDPEYGLLVRSSIAGSVPTKAKVRSVKRVGGRWLATLRCDAPIGSVCAGTLRVRATGRKVQSAKYYVSAATASRTTTVRRLPLPKRARGVAVSVR